MRVGVDTGGTFTDAVTEHGDIVKVLSTPADPSIAVAQAAVGVTELAHGTTVATNALLERRGGVVTLVTDDGFRDLIEIARQDRPSLYDPWADRPAPLVDRAHRIVAGEEVPSDTTAVAVCLLHADRDPGPEARAATALRASGWDVSASHEVAPEFREYERFVTTVVTAYLRPACAAYLEALANVTPSVAVLTSASGLVPLAAAATNPAALLLSGPAAGVLAGAAVAVEAGFPDAVTFDMGGTSTDVCLVLDGRPAPAGFRVVAGFPIRLPSLDVHTIGAGGGSIARIDAGGALTVGPQSAGARPGPACYGLGGQLPTVTDADLVAGRLPASLTLPGIGRLDSARSRAALGPIDPNGVIDVVDAAMVEAVRAVTVRRGVDPATLALVAFGGAGPVHACAVAAALGMRAVVVPPAAGVLSALGLLQAPYQCDLVRSWNGGDLEAALVELGSTAADELMDHGRPVVTTAVDCRYAGQGHELTVANVASFEDTHARVNGYRLPGTPVEVVAIRASARVYPRVPAPVRVVRHAVTGPATVAEQDCTLWVPAGWSAHVHASGAWVVRPR